MAARHFKHNPMYEGVYKILHLSILLHIYYIYIYIYIYIYYFITHTTPLEREIRRDCERSGEQEKKEIGDYRCSVERAVQDE